MFRVFGLPWVFGVWRGFNVCMDAFVAIAAVSVGLEPVAPFSGIIWWWSDLCGVLVTVGSGEVCGRGEGGSVVAEMVGVGGAVFDDGWFVPRFDGGLATYVVVAGVFFEELEHESGYHGGGLGEAAIFQFGEVFGEAGVPLYEGFVFGFVEVVRSEELLDESDTLCGVLFLRERAASDEDSHEITAGDSLCEVGVAFYGFPEKFIQFEAESAADITFDTECEFVDPNDGGGGVFLDEFFETPWLGYHVFGIAKRIEKGLSPERRSLWLH